MPPTLRVEEQIPLSSHTTLELGGPATFFTLVHSRETLLEALSWAQSHALPVTVLGGGSNILVSDQGISGLVLKMVTLGVEMQEQSSGSVCVTAQAGETWDSLVSRCVQEQLAGIECLSGIPGSVGAAPVQNIGAYGQELADCVRSVEVLDLTSLRVLRRSRAECEFEYRNSRWKRAPGREIVLSVELALERGGAPQVRYAELARALAARVGPGPTLDAVRETVLGLRRGKSMLLDAADENRRSVGSFFLNPIVSVEEAERVSARALAAGVIADARELPRYPAPSGSVKLSAAWLIERSGTRKGERFGQVGVSSRHCLALVHHGGGTTRELLALAHTVQARVRDAFGVELVPEPVALGFD